jgi:hypothetical protein
MDKSEIIKICIAGVVAIIALIQLGMGVHSLKADWIALVQCASREA